MELKIMASTSLQEIKTVFHERYAGLKLDFFIDENGDGNYTANEKITDYSLTLSEIGAKNRQASVVIDDNTTVEQLEQHFTFHFGVIVQVFRKSGSAWLMTSTSDRQTLSELNKNALISQEAGKADKPIDAADRADLE